MTGLVCISALKALADETRLRMLRLLLKEQLSVNFPAQWDPKLGIHVT